MCKDLQPSLTLLFDLSPEIGLARAWKQINSGDRVDSETRFEEETVDFHRKVREGYLELARLTPDRFHLIDASRDEESVRMQIFSVLTRHLITTPVPEHAIEKGQK
jgi:dTMP kinase